MPEFYSPVVTDLYDAMRSSIQRIGIVQTNLENVNTVGYKSIHPDSVLFANTLKQVFRDNSQGELLNTNNKLDLALSKADAYFLVEGVNGPERTRDGQFHVNEEGKIVDIENRELVILDQRPGKSIVEKLINGSDLEVDKHGRLRIDGEFYGRIPVDYKAAEPGQSVYVIQGRLETSNVDLQDNITKLMQVKRHIDTINGMLAMELSVDKSLVETYGRNV